MHDLQDHQNTVVRIQSKLTLVVDLLQHHTVVVDHTVRGDYSSAFSNQLQSDFGTIRIHGFQPLCSGDVSIQSHKIVAPYGLQIGKVGDDCSLLAAECQVDKIFDIA